MILALADQRCGRKIVRLWRLVLCSGCWSVKFEDDGKESFRPSGLACSSRRQARRISDLLHQQGSVTVDCPRKSLIPLWCRDVSNIQTACIHQPLQGRVVTRHPRGRALVPNARLEVVLKRCRAGDHARKHANDMLCFQVIR